MKEKAQFNKSIESKWQNDDEALPHINNELISPEELRRLYLIKNGADQFLSQEARKRIIEGNDKLALYLAQRRVQVIQMFYGLAPYSELFILKEKPWIF